MEQGGGNLQGCLKQRTNEFNGKMAVWIMDWKGREKEERWESS